MPIELPPELLRAVQDGDAILFLGSGASIGATHATAGKAIPKGNDLKILLCDRFLGGRMKDRSLAAVSQFCVSEAGLGSLQNYIRDLLIGFGPAHFHMKLPDFRWHAIATTNYDLIIEKAFKGHEAPHQTLIPFLKDTQQVEREAKRSVDPLHFLKLHGSIDAIHDDDIPLILTTDQYINYSSHRMRLFSMLRGWATEFQIIFCGYSLDDINVRTVLFDLFDRNIRRPTYYNVTPHYDEIEGRQWVQQRIFPIRATFEQFIDALDVAVPAAKRTLSTLVPHAETSLTRFLRVTDRKESEDLRKYLAADVIHIHKGMPVKQAKASDYYKGYDIGLEGISTNLDIRRKVGDTLLIDAVLKEETVSRRPVELFVLRGAAGNGKTTVLKRCAWDAANEYEAIVLYLADGGAIQPTLIEEIFALCKVRIFVFVDRAAVHADELQRAITYLTARRAAVTFVTTERDNEWNTRCEQLEQYVNEAYPIRYLSDDEIVALLHKLEQHDALGLLGEIQPADRIAALKDRAQRQILVALHEATLGKPFEDIVADEYRRIVPDEARLMYLDICTLNRFGLGVRAGVIARISGISFDDFERRLFKPLEKIVFSELDRYIGDRVFRTRHPHVAEIVFSEVLSDAEHKFDQIVRMISGLNVTYSVDKEAFDLMTRGRTVADAFPSVEMGRALFRAAAQVVPNDAYLFHQEGIFELQHPGGSLSRAEECLLQAEQLIPHDPSIQHSLATWYRRKALNEPNDLLRSEYRSRALSRLADGSGRERKHVYAANTRLLILIDELKEMLPDGDDGNALNERALVERLKNIDEQFLMAHQLFPGEEHLLSTEATYRAVVKDHPKTLKALQQAFAANPRQEWIAVRLADYFSNQNDPTAAKEVLQKVVAENPTAKQAHLRLGKLQATSSVEADRRFAAQHFRSAFSNGDNNYEAQLWYARELHLAGKYQEARDLFAVLREARIQTSEKRKPIGHVYEGGDKLRTFRGQVLNVEAGYLFIGSHEHGESIFCHEANVDPTEWGTLRPYDEVTFNLAFNYQGPVAVNVQRLH